MSDQDLRISDADRDQAAADLGEHYALGRLTTEEHRERLDQVWAARTRRELGPLFADLPGEPLAVRPGPATTRSAVRRPRWRRLPPPLIVLLVVLGVVAIVAHLPLVLVGIGVWLLVSRGSCGSRTPRRS